MYKYLKLEIGIRRGTHGIQQRIGLSGAAFSKLS